MPVGDLCAKTPAVNYYTVQTVTAGYFVQAPTGNYFIVRAFAFGPQLRPIHQGGQPQGCPV